MPQKQVSKRHHYIPEFYLSEWYSGGHRKLVQYSKPYGDEVKALRVSPKQTGWKPKLYWLNGLSDEAAAIIEEKFFAPVDSNASLVFRRMHEGAVSFTSAERIAWTQFLMSLNFRHPEHIEATRHRLSESIRETTRAQERQYRRGRRPGDPKTMKEALAIELERDPDRVHRQAVHLAAQMTESENIGRHIYQMRWGSMRMPLGVRALLTSDRPLHWFGGLADKGCHMLMPLGPKRVFWAVNHPYMAEFIMAQTPETIVRFVNENSVKRAREFVYGKGDDQLAYVQEHMGTGQDLSVADMISRLPTGRERRRHKAVFNPPSLIDP